MLVGSLTYLKNCVAWVLFVCLAFSSCISASESAGKEAFKNSKAFPVYKVHVHLWLEFLSSNRQRVQKIFELWVGRIAILLFLKVSWVYVFSENNRTHFSSCKVVKLSISMCSFSTILSFSFWQSLSI